MSVKQIILGGGCFWCIEAIFENIKGIKYTEVGYSGDIPNSSYESVCAGDGNIEVTKIIFDENEIPLTKILEIFFRAHDVTSLDKQGFDEGIQYRSAIFYDNERDKKIIKKFIKEEQKKYTSTIVTKLYRLKNYTKGEEYHQKYFNKNPDAMYCRLVINPKINKILDS